MPCRHALATLPLVLFSAILIEASAAQYSYTSQPLEGKTYWEYDDKSGYTETPRQFTVRASFEFKDPLIEGWNALKSDFTLNWVIDVGNYIFVTEWFPAYFTGSVFINDGEVKSWDLMATGNYYEIDPYRVGDVSVHLTIAGDTFTFAGQDYNYNFGANGSSISPGNWVSTIPEPQTILLAMAGLAGVSLFARRDTGMSS